MRLIDADKLADELRNVETSLARNGVYLVKNNASIYKMIENQPTAYDVDKVVEEFTDEAYGSESDVYIDMMLDEAVDIVKRGGINE